MRLIIGFMLGIFVTSNAHVLIITHSYNRPEFIAWQAKTFKKFFKNEYEFVVFNDAPQLETELKINHVCEQYGIRCIRIPQEIHTRPYLYREPREDVQNACCRCANVVQYSLDVLGFAHNDLVMIIDSDMFLIRDFDLRRYMQHYDLAGVAQWRGPRDEVHYLWNGLLFFDMPHLPNKKLFNVNCGMVDGQPTDVGGYLHYYFKETPGVHVKCFDEHLYLPDVHKNLLFKSTRSRGERITNYDINQQTKEWPHIQQFISQRPHDVSFFANYTFLHYQRGTNYHNMTPRYHEAKTKMLEQFIWDITA